MTRVTSRSTGSFVYQRFACRWFLRPDGQQNELQAGKVVQARKGGTARSLWLRSVSLRSPANVGTRLSFVGVLRAASPIDPKGGLRSMGQREEPQGKPESAAAGQEGPPSIKRSVHLPGERLRREFELVPPIGSLRRWYDLPYRLIQWLLASPHFQRAPWRVRRSLNRALNFFVIFNFYDRLKVQERSDPTRNIIVPTEANLSQGGIWVTEVFPPSHYSALLRGLSVNGWDRADYMRSGEGTNAEQVTRARRGQGFVWTRLGSVTNPQSRYFAFDAKREVLPKEFDLVELTAVQLGSSLTCVTAFYQLSEKGANSLNDVWKSEHEPTLEWRGLRRPHVQDRRSAAIQATQWERDRLHNLARKWLKERCGGFFASTEAGHPVIDFNLFKGINPRGRAEGVEQDEVLRALGMDGNGLYEYVSEQLPGTALVQGQQFPRLGAPLMNCWGVVGEFDVVARLNDQPGYGQRPYSVNALAAMANEHVPNFLLHVALVQYGRQLQEIASASRDTARTNHGKFRPRRVEKLQRELLTTSLDLPAVARDSGILWKSSGRPWAHVTVKGVPVTSGNNPPEEFDLIERLGTVRETVFEQLLEEDATYRTVLSSASSLGASATTARLGILALVVSGMSLVASVVTLLVASGN